MTAYGAGQPRKAYWLGETRLIESEGSNEERQQLEWPTDRSTGCGRLRKGRIDCSDESLEGCGRAGGYHLAAFRQDSGRQFARAGRPNRGNENGRWGESERI